MNDERLNNWLFVSIFVIGHISDLTDMRYIIQKVKISQYTILHTSSHNKHAPCIDIIVLKFKNIHLKWILTNHIQEKGRCRGLNQRHSNVLKSTIGNPFRLKSIYVSTFFYIFEFKLVKFSHFAMYIGTGKDW